MTYPRKRHIGDRVGTIPHSAPVYHQLIDAAFIETSTYSMPADRTFHCPHPPCTGHRRYKRSGDLINHLKSQHPQLVDLDLYIQPQRFFRARLDSGADHSLVSEAVIERLRFDSTPPPTPDRPETPDLGTLLLQMARNRSCIRSCIDERDHVYALLAIERAYKDKTLARLPYPELRHTFFVDRLQQPSHKLEHTLPTYKDTGTVSMIRRHESEGWSLSMTSLQARECLIHTPMSCHCGMYHVWYCCKCHHPSCLECRICEQWFSR